MPCGFDNLYTHSITKYDWNKKELHRKKNSKLPPNLSQNHET